ncbi:hypothetical protein [Vibrio phage LP.2]|nr:hypothetical protein [Vibrio phage LP.2]
MVLNNQKKEAFAQKWHETGNKSEAYRYSHPNSSKWKDETVHKRASELSQDGEVLGRYKELQEETAQNHGVTIESLLQELSENRKLALEAMQLSAANAATMGKAKLCGLDIQKVEHSGVVPLTIVLDEDED